MVRYIAFRSRELEHDTKGAFDRERDHADVARFCKQLEDPKTRHARAAKAYHCLFSLPRDDFERTGTGDWKEVVRDTLSTYERNRNRRLEWIAAEHKDLEHPHCHVVIKAVYETGEGARRQLRLSKEDIKEIRQVLGKELARRREAFRAMHPEPPRLTFQRLNMTVAVDRLLQWMSEQIRQERRHRQREMDEAHDRWLRDDGRDR